MTVEGTAHSIAMLDEAMQERILNFFARTLATLEGPAPRVEAGADDADG